MEDAKEIDSIPTTPQAAETILRTMIVRGILSLERIQTIVDEERQHVGEIAREVAKIQKAPGENIIRAARVVFKSCPNGIGRDALDLARKALGEAGFPSATLKWAPVDEQHRNGIAILLLDDEAVAVPFGYTSHDSSTQPYYHHARLGTKFRGRFSTLVRVCALDENEEPYTTRGQDKNGYATIIPDKDLIGLVQ